MHHLPARVGELRCCQRTVALLSTAFPFPSPVTWLSSQSVAQPPKSNQPRQHYRCKPCRADPPERCLNVWHSLRCHPARSQFSPRRADGCREDGVQASPWSPGDQDCCDRTSLSKLPANMKHRPPISAGNLMVGHHPRGDRLRERRISPCRVSFFYAALTLSITMASGTLFADDPTPGTQHTLLAVSAWPRGVQ